MKRLLVYIEPHPVRNSFITHADIFVPFLESLATFRPADYEVRIFSSNESIDYLLKKQEYLAPWVIRPTAHESAVIRSFLINWSSVTIATAISLSLGKGDVSSFYYTILSRIYTRIFRFDTLLFTSANGAVRRFAREQSIKLGNIAPGPLRFKGYDTFSLDPGGMAVNSALIHAPCEALRPAISVPPATWLARAQAAQARPDQTGCLDSPLAYHADAPFKAGAPYCLLCLQPADRPEFYLASPFTDQAAFLKNALAYLSNRFGETRVLKFAPSRGGHAWIEQEKALATIDSSQKNIKILEQPHDSETALTLIAQASSTMSVNSSFSFLAEVFGKTGIASGVAKYNLGRMFSPADPSASAASPDPETRQRLLSWLLCHYYHPYGALRQSGVVYAYFDFLLSHAYEPALPGFWEAWTECLDYGFRFLLYRSGDAQPAAPALDYLREIREHTENGKSFARISGLGEYAHEDGRLFHVVDVVKREKDFVEINGWCLDTEDNPPALIVGAQGDKIIGLTGPNVDRLDVLRAKNISHPVRCGYALRLPGTALEAQTLTIYLLGSDGHFDKREIIL